MKNASGMGIVKYPYIDQPWLTKQELLVRKTACFESIPWNVLVDTVVCIGIERIGIPSMCKIVVHARQRLSKTFLSYSKRVVNVWQTAFLVSPSLYGPLSDSPIKIKHLAEFSRVNSSAIHRSTYCPRNRRHSS